MEILFYIFVFILSQFLNGCALAKNTITLEIMENSISLDPSSGSLNSYTKTIITRISKKFFFTYNGNPYI